MARPKEGWKLRRKPGERVLHVRFTLGGRRVERSTGETSEERAAAVAERIYLAALSGHVERPKRRPALGGRSIREVAAQWLSARDSTLDPRTAETYALYVSAHFAPFFGTLEQVTTSMVEDYIAARLRKVKAGTVRKELSALRSLLEYCCMRRYLVEAPEVPPVPKRAVGTEHPQGRRQRTPLAPEEARAIIDALPEWAPKGSLGPDGKLVRWPIRARYLVMYETTLRPETIDRLSVPEHYTLGSRRLRLTPELDKARHGRDVPLSRAAQEALEAVAPRRGLIFGAHRSVEHLERAARLVLPRERAETFHPYDLRAAAITHLLERTGNLPGVQHLAGHRHVSTTARYVGSSYRAAEEVLAAVSGRLTRPPRNS